MKRSLLFVHSAGPQGPLRGSGGLIASLRSAVGARHELVAPRMPEPEAPTYARWREVLARELSVLNGAVTLVGHSLGGSVVPFSHLEAYTARLPGATIRGLAGGDHFFENGLAELLNDIESGIQDSGFGIQGSGVMLATPPLNPKS